MPEELSLEQGIQKSYNILITIIEKPIMTAVYGVGNSGKSYFIDQLADLFEKQGLKTYRGTGAPSFSIFERIINRPETLKPVLIFHCGWPRLSQNPHYQKAFADRDPNIMAQKIANKKVHLNIGIYNPKMARYPNGEYDFVISNPDSKVKL